MKDPLVTTDLPLPRTDSTDVAVQATVENVSDQPHEGVLEGASKTLLSSRKSNSPRTASRLVSSTPRTRRRCTSSIRGCGGPMATARRISTSCILTSSRERRFRRAGRGLRRAQDHLLGSRLRHADHLREWRACIHSRRRLGTGRGDEAHSARAARGADSHAPAGQYEHDPQLGGTEHRRGFLRAVRQVRHPAVGRVFPAQSARRARSHRYRYLYGQRARQDSALPQPSLHRPVVRAQRRLSAAGDRCGSAQAVAELEPTRRYQPSSTDGAGVRSHGPYCWRTPREFYTRHGRLLQNRDRQRVRSDARIHPRHDAARRIGRPSTTTGPSTTWPRARSSGDKYPGDLAAATARSPTSPTLSARRSWRTTRRSAPCTKDATRNCSIPRPASSPG